MGESLKKLTFCPTFVTSLMFNWFKQENFSKVFLTGHYGFSKTFSVALYALLSNYIVEYRLKYPSPTVKLTDNILKRYKLIYWTINKKSYSDEVDAKMKK